MILTDALPSKYQNRIISGIGYQSRMIARISDEMLNQIRLICLSIIDNFPDFLIKEDKHFRISLQPKQIESSLQKSIEAVKDLFSAQKELFEQAQQASELYYKSKIQVRFPIEDLKTTGGIFSDRRLENWINYANEKAIFHFDKQCGAEMFEIPVEDHFLSCYNYALLKAGVKWEPAHLNISKESLLSFLLSQCESISVPHDGDFVLFLQDGELVHLGLSQQGKILSKEGNACRFASLKRLEDLSSEYGNQVLYFRFSP